MSVERDVAWAAGFFDGEGCVRRAEKVQNHRCYPIGIWQVTGMEAEYAAWAMLDYSILKKEQLELFLEAREKTIVPKGHRLPEGTHDLRMKFAEKIKRLKRPQWDGREVVARVS